MHYLGNALAHVSSVTWKQDVRDGLRDVCRSDAWRSRGETPASGRKSSQAGANPRGVAGAYRRRNLTFLEHCAPEHRRPLKTTNSMEHDSAEVRRRSRVVRIVPNEASLIRLLGALAIERNEQWMGRITWCSRQT